jgi:hypothetical protein
MKCVPQDPNEQSQKANHEPGTKSHVRTQQVNVNDNLSVIVRANTKDAEQVKKVNCKPGTKSRVGQKDGNLDDSDSDVQIIHHKAGNSLLDVIDLTDDIDSPEGLAPHVIMTKIAEGCNIYTCTFCEGTFTGKGYANYHMCKTREPNSLSPNKNEHRKRRLRAMH